MTTVPRIEAHSLPPGPHGLETGADVVARTGNTVNGVGSALGTTLAPFVPLIGPALTLGVTWLGLKAIIKGENPLK